MPAGVPEGEFASNYVNLRDFLKTCCFAKSPLYLITAPGCGVPCVVQQLLRAPEPKDVQTRKGSDT